MQQDLERDGVSKGLLVPFLWRDLEFSNSEQAQMLLVLMSFGALFPRPEDGAWLVPIRLPMHPQQNLDLLWQPWTLFNNSNAPFREDRLQVRFVSSRFLPPGLFMRFLAGLCGVGRFLCVWRTGAILEQHEGSSSTGLNQISCGSEERNQKHQGDV